MARQREPGGMINRVSRSGKLLPSAVLATTALVGAAQAQTATGNVNLEDNRPGAGAIQLHGAYFGDAFADVAGGAKQGTTYIGRVGVTLHVDLDRTIGWRGATFHVSAHQIHGVPLTPGFVGALNTVSGLEAEPSTRLNNLWIEQALGKVSVRAGQFQASQEFLVSAAGASFVNSTFGWPTIAAADLPSGGATYPLATAGVRVAWRPNPRTSLLAAACNGDPAGPGGGDPQRRDASGFNSLRVAGPPFLIAEVTRGSGGTAKMPTTTVHLGGWIFLGHADDQRRGTDGSLLDDPAGVGVPARHRRNYQAYAIVDQALGALGPGQVAAFARFAVAPADRNLVRAYADGGLTWTGPFRGRPEDVLGVALATTGLSDGPPPTASTTGARDGERSGETVIEVGYAAQVSKALSVHPDVQYIVHPGLRFASGSRALPASRTADALVVGLRTVARF